jgi:uncharacterized surface protein with fasciclin (FAS1) repeats
MRSKSTLLTATAVALPLGLGAWSAEAANIYETLQERDEFSKFVEAIETAELQETLENEGPFTVFAPTDEAIEELPEELRNALLEEDYRDQLESLVRMHIVENQELTTEALRENETLRPDVITMEGETISLDFDNDEMIVRLAAAEPTIDPQPVDPAVTPDPADPVDPAFVPADPAAAAEPVTPEVTEAPAVAEPVTPEVAEAPEVTQPFEEDYERIGARFEATVVEADIEADNGVIHAIDAVLVPHPVAQEMAGVELDDEAEE